MTIPSVDIIPAAESDNQAEEKDTPASAQEDEDTQMAEMLTIMWAVTADDSRGKTPSGEWLRGDGDTLRVFLDTAENIGATTEALDRFLGEFAVKVRWRIACDTHRRMSVKLAKVLAADPNGDLVECLAKNKQTPPQILTALTKHPLPDVRKNAIENPGLPTATLDALSTSTDSNIRASVARNTSTPAGTLTQMANNPDETESNAKIIFHNRSCPAATANLLDEKFHFRFDPDRYRREHNIPQPR